MDKEFEKEILERLIRIETKLDDYDSIKTKVEETRSKAHSNERRITELEDKQKYLSKTIVGAIIGGIVSLIFIVIKLGLGLE